MQSFVQYITEGPDATTNPYHKTLTQHGFTHTKTEKHPIGVGHLHTYHHPQGDSVEVGHIGPERSWQHKGYGDKAGITIKSLKNRLDHVATNDRPFFGTHGEVKESSGGPDFSKGDGPIPDHTKNPFHSTLVKHGFKHVSSKEGAYKGSESHVYEHPTKGHVSATVYPKNHGMGETHWRHSHPNPEHRNNSSSAGKTAKSLDDYMNHPDGKNAKIRGVHHMGY